MVVTTATDSGNNRPKYDWKLSQHAQRPSSPTRERPPIGSKRPSHYSVTSTVSATASSVGDASEVTAPVQTIRDVSQAFRTGPPSPYHMAIVTLIGSLASGMSLASMFKVYTYVMCAVYDPSIRDGGGQGKSWSVPHLSRLPPAPQLPSPPQCSSPWVQKSTSSYSAAMITVGALLGLMTLSRASALSRRFGRKPLLLIAHVVLVLSLLVFRAAVLLPPYAAAVGLYCAVVFSEAAAGAPLRIALQNYVVDTTLEAQRAGALSFIEGFGQIGAFPSSALGGLLASATGEFFAPFYADIGLLIVVIAYILVLVPESKAEREHTLIDNWEHSDQVENGDADAGQGDAAEEAGGVQSPNDNGSSYTWSTTHEASDASRFKWRSRLQALNFLRPLSIFRPRRRYHSDTTTDEVLSAPPDDEIQSGQLSATVGKIKDRIDFRLLNLALVVIFEETYQVFLIPLLLLYNGQRFGFDVLQNGYLISILQSTRALFLAAIFPPGVALARKYVTKVGLARRKRKLAKLGKNAGKRKKQPHSRGDESQPLVGDVGPSDDTGKRQSDGYGALNSYDFGYGEGGRAPHENPDSEPSLIEARPVRRRPSHRSAASFGYSKLSKNKANESRITIVSSGWDADSVFTSPPTELIKRIQRGKLDISIMLVSYLLACASFLVLASTAWAPSASEKGLASATSSGAFWSSPWIPLTVGVIGLQLASGSTSVRTALVVNAVSEEEQTKALAAHQILCTTVNASMPLLTSFVYGIALENGKPHLVWLFKAIFAALSACGAAGLFWSHRGFYEKAHADDDGSADEASDDGGP